jgi:spore coat protein U-like protein
MEMKRWVVTAAALAVAGWPTSASAQGQSRTANLRVTASVVGNCLVTTTDVAFGNYDPVATNASTPADATGTVDVTCIQGVVATIGLDVGANAQGTTRRMADGGANRLEYELYRDAGRSQIWGNTAGSNMVLPAAPSTATRTYTVYGRVRQAQNIPVGSYSDTVVVTVSF